MSLKPRRVDFDQTWSEIRQTVKEVSTFLVCTHDEKKAEKFLRRRKFVCDVAPLFCRSSHLAM